MDKKMNKLLCMVVVLLSLAACTEDTEYTAGVWYRRSDFDGVARNDAARVYYWQQRIYLRRIPGKQQRPPERLLGV